MQQQIRRLHAGVHVVVGTPGRIMDHLRRETLELDVIRMVVLDEGDDWMRSPACWVEAPEAALV
jgi:ATP-dependent RNA helicase DeaD